MKSIRAIPAGFLLIVLAACQALTPTSPVLPVATPTSAQVAQGGTTLPTLTTSAGEAPASLATATLPSTEATTPPTATSLPDASQASWQPVASGYEPVGGEVIFTHAAETDRGFYRIRVDSP